jgi:hypothetical protein
MSLEKNKNLRFHAFLLELVTLHSGKLSRHFHYFGMWHITDSNGVSDPGPTVVDSLTARDSAP